MKKIAILQSNYIPWKGYFDIIAAVDEFVLYDEMQYTKNDWRNRNRIKTPNGTEWITIPVGQNINRRIRDVELPNSRWQTKHWRTLTANYRRSKYFDEISEWLMPLYLDEIYTNLSSANRSFIEAICQYLGITTKISNSCDYGLAHGKTERLIDLCKRIGCNEYVSGPAAKSYIDSAAFADHGISLTWIDYSGYPVYPQLWGDFVHEVSILDLLFNCGPQATNYMRYVTK